MRRKFEREMAAVYAKTELKQELMKKESDPWKRANVASAAATAAAPQRRTMSEEDDIWGTVPPEVKSIILQFAGLPQEEIKRELQNSFKPINLYCQY